MISSKVSDDFFGLENDFIFHDFLRVMERYFF